MTEYYGAWESGDNLERHEWYPLPGAKGVTIRGFEALHLCTWKASWREWQVIEATSGWLMAIGTTRREAIEDCRRRMEEVGLAKVEQIIARAIERSGPSPWRPEEGER